MDGAPSSANEWIWWVISVVVMGILINLASSFLYPRLEKKWAENSEKRRKIIEQREKEFSDRVEKIKSDPIKILELRIGLLTNLVGGIVYGVLLMVIDDVIKPFIMDSMFITRFFWFGNMEYFNFFITGMATFIVLVLIMIQWNKFRDIQTLLHAVSENN